MELTDEQAELKEIDDLMRDPMTGEFFSSVIGGKSTYERVKLLVFDLDNEWSEEIEARQRDRLRLQKAARKVIDYWRRLYRSVDEHACRQVKEIDFLRARDNEYRYSRRWGAAWMAAAKEHRRNYRAWEYTAIFVLDVLNEAYRREDELEAERDEWEADAGRYSRMSGEAIRERDALQERLDETERVLEIQGIPRKDIIGITHSIADMTIELASQRDNLKLRLHDAEVALDENRKMVGAANKAAGEAKADRDELRLRLEEMRDECQPTCPFCGREWIDDNERVVHQTECPLCEDD